MKKKQLSIISTTLILGFISNIYAAKPFVVTVKCPVQVFDPSLAPKQLPDYYYGQAKDSNKEKACKAAEKKAKEQFPRGTKPKHCRCYDTK